ncbi:MAG: endoribonuclease YicC domain-containing protein, partial [Dongiaceae bacterium]
EEGDRLSALIGAQVGAIDRLRSAAAATAAAQPAALKLRLKSQLDALLEATSSFSEDRLVQEVALLVTKSDVREELDRLAAHVAGARKLIAEGGAIGRRFDFLCQEFNREANTLCSKSADVELTGIGLELKAVIDQLREQAQNIE